MKNRFPKATPCGATLVASVSLTSKLAFRIPNLGEKIQSPNIFKDLGIGFPRLKVFAVLF